MTDPLDPPRRPELRVGRGAERRSTPDRRGPPATAPEGNTLVPIGPVETASTPPPEDGLAGAAAYHAQLLGGAPRRGLKGGPETLEEARHTYLETEYSGPADRRPKKGNIDTEV
jgi:hypothetical protein